MPSRVNISIGPNSQIVITHPHDDPPSPALSVPPPFSRLCVMALYFQVARGTCGKYGGKYGGKYKGKHG